MNTEQHEIATRFQQFQAVTLPDGQRGVVVCVDRNGCCAVCLDESYRAGEHPWLFDCSFTCCGDWYDYPPYVLWHPEFGME